MTIEYSVFLSFFIKQIKGKGKGKKMGDEGAEGGKGKNRGGGR